MVNRGTFQEHLNRGWEYLEKSDFSNARIQFEHAHAAGVFSISQHGRSHFGKLCLAVKEKKASSVVGQVFFLVAAIFSPLSCLLYKLNLVKVRNADETLATGKRTLMFTCSKATS